MAYNPQNPLIIQSDKSILLEVDNDRYEDARDLLARFAELVKSPEHVHTYRITPLSLWNAAASGMQAEAIVDVLHEYSKYEVPGNVVYDIRDYVNRFGQLKLVRAQQSDVPSASDDLLLVSDDPALIAQVAHHRKLSALIVEQIDATTLRIDPALRGRIKQALIQFGFPAQDMAGYVEGDTLAIHFREETASGEPFSLRSYQREAAQVFHAGGQDSGGSGVIVLPCGAGKTIVGIAAMVQAGCATLILTPSTVAARQWRTELLDKTDLRPEDIGEYTGQAKEICPVTLTTYQILIHRKRKGARFVHFGLFNERNWGLIIYDEVHLLPAPIFRITSEIQARRRLGLTATLIREDGKETDVFALIGPKKYDVPWKVLEKQGWIATAECHEIRVPLNTDDRMVYAIAEAKEKATLAANNAAKMPVLQLLLDKHREDSTLVIGTYLRQLSQIAKRFHIPLITGKTPVAQREVLFEQLREGEIRVLAISKVGNFSVDLPDVNVAIQVSGTFGSRQEEAQRLGRILRPKRSGLMAHFYSLVSKDTREQEFAARRQLFLTEQGYRYEIMDDTEVADYEPTLLALEAIEEQTYLITG